MMSINKCVSSHALHTAMATSTLFNKGAVAKKLNDISLKEFIWRDKPVNLRMFKTFGLAASALTSTLAAIDFFEHYKRSDNDAAAALGASALVSGSLATIGIASLLNYGWAAAVPNPVVWTLMAVSIGLGFLAMYLRDKPLPDWVSHGPFGQHAFDGSYKAWADSPKNCYKALLGQLVRPQLTLETEIDNQLGQEVVAVQLDIPFFTPGVDSMAIHTTYQSEKLEGHGNYQAPVLSRQQAITPYKVVQVANDQGTQVAAVRYYYKIPAKTGQVRSHKWRTRAQIKSGEITLPVEYKPGLYKVSANPTTPLLRLI
jgi:hypothetical protein